MLPDQQVKRPIFIFEYAECWSTGRKFTLTLEATSIVFPFLRSYAREAIKVDEKDEKIDAKFLEPVLSSWKV